MIKSLLLFSVFILAPSLYAAEATITSDDLELKNNGELTIFRGHVVLTQVPYEVRSDRMVRTKRTGLVKATGHVVATWISPKNEKVRVEGTEATYDAQAELVEVWGPPQVVVHLDGEKGKATFHGDRGKVFTHTPGKARLTGLVTGHIIPGGAR